MQYIFTIPFLIATYYVLKGQRDRAFLNIYLPCTFLMPYYYSFRLPHFPLIYSGTSALLPIGLSVLFHPKAKFKLRRMDVLIVLYVIAYTLSEFVKDKDWRLAAFTVLNTPVLELFMGYCVGRGAIEPNLRVPTAKRIVLCLMLLAPMILFEYRFAQNPWLMLAHTLNLQDVNWSVQLRDGHARIAACFGHAILAGTIFMCALALNAALQEVYQQSKTRLGSWMSRLQRFHVPFILLTCFLLMTRSRGPIGCAAICFLILQIPKFRNMRAAAGVVLVILVVGAISVSTYLDRYTDKTSGTMTEEQSSAVYRRTLLTAYKPILEDGGWLGYGVYNRPVVQGLGSTDNNYLLVQMIQGKVGLYLFILIGVDSIWTLVVYAMTFRSRESLYFVFALMSALAGIFLSLTTVYLGEQLAQVLFLLAGWAQSLQDTSEVSSVRVEVSPRFRFRRVFT